MKKLFLSTVMMLTFGMSQAVEVSTFSDLLSAIKSDQDITLVSDITLSSSDISSFNGYLKNIQYNPYTKIFDGQGHTISNLQSGTGCMYKLGLFRALKNAVVKNVNLTDVAIKGEENIGALANFAENTLIENVSVQGSIFSNNDEYGTVGGIIGSGDYVEIKDCKTQMTLRVDGQIAGGIVGGLSNGRISNCTAEVNLFCDGNWYDGIAGGICGRARRTSIIGCVAKGRVESYSEQIGGIAGYAYDNTGEAVIENCRNEAAVTLTGNRYDDYAGGIAGKAAIMIRCCENYGPVAGCNYIGGIVGSGKPWDNGQNTHIENCVSAGAVYGTDDSVGGIAGEMADGCCINRCFVKAEVYKDNSRCGKWGVGTSDGEVKNCCYTYGNSSPESSNIPVNNEELAGGFVTNYLNGLQTSEENAWRQNIDKEGREADSEPVLCTSTSQLDSHSLVYKCQDEWGREYYSNYENGKQSQTELQNEDADAESMARKILVNGKVVITTADGHEYNVY